MYLCVCLFRHYTIHINDRNDDNTLRWALHI